MKHLAENISTIRGVAEMTQAAFGKAIGGSKGNKGKIYSYEKMDVTPPPITLQRIADFAGVTIDDLLNRKLKEADISIKSDKSNKQVKPKTYDLDDTIVITRREITELKASVSVLQLKVINLLAKVESIPFDEAFLDVQTKTEKAIERLEGKGDNG